MATVDTHTRDAAVEAVARKDTGVKRLLQIIAIVSFVLVGGVEALPCFCEGGEIASNAEFALLFYILFRLIWQAYRRTFSFRDYFIYCAIFAAFCFWMRSYV